MSTETKDKPKRVAKRKLSNIDFSKVDSHIALVSKDQGGPANGADYQLVIKSTDKFSEEFVEKAQRIQVTMDIPDFLEKFFYMYGDDAEALAKLMGYVDLDDVYESEPEFMLVNSDYQDQIDSMLASAEVMKALYEADNKAEVLAGLSEEQYLTFLQDQERLEKAFKKAESYKEPKEKSKPSKTPAKKPKMLLKTVEVPAVNPTDTLSKNVEETVVKSTKEEVMQEQNTDSKTIQTEVEVVEKSQFDSIQKAFEAQAEQLQKALEALEVVQKEKQAVIAKARKNALTEAVGVQEKVEVLFKAFGEIQDDGLFDEVLTVLKSLTAVQEQSDLFKEQGVSGEADAKVQDPKAAVANLLKAKYAIKA